MTTLEKVLSIVGEKTRSAPYPYDIVNWCNDCQTDFMLNINLPATATINVNTTDLSYALPTDLKVINRMSLVSVDYGLPLNKEYRLFNGNIIFTTPFTEVDTINLEYSKHYTVYDEITDTLDLPERFVPLYVAYCLMQHYSLPQANMNESQARQEVQKYQYQYSNLKQQVISYYSLSSEPGMVEESW